MAKSPEEIVALWKQRKIAKGPLIAAMEEVREAYNGDVAIPLPELNTNERAAVANLLAQGLDQQSMRVGSVMPDVFYPPDIPGQKTAEAYARIRRQANLGWWHQNKMRLKMRRRARYMIGYATAPVILRPNQKLGIPMWHIRNPLTTYEAPSSDVDNITPENCIFSFTRSLAWLREHYPFETAMLYKGDNPEDDDLFDLVEYVDAEELVLLAVGKQKESWHQTTDGLYSIVELGQRVENRTGMCTAVVPGRITLDRPQGQFDGIIGMYQTQAKLMALEVIAVEKGIFPDTYLISRPQELASFVAGPFDGRTGKVNIVKGGDIRDVQTNPGFQTNPTIDRLERAQRLTGGIPAEFGGESTSNVRTGRRGDAILSAVVDFPIQEAQELFSEALMEENRRAVAIDKAYFDKPKSFYVSWKGAKGRVDYTPSVHFTSDVNFVTYSQAGADINNLVIGGGQRVGMGSMSIRTFQEIDPLIDDPEQEHDRSIVEALERSMLTGIQEMAAQGALAPVDVARIMELVASDKKDLAGAIQQAQEEAQQRQASAGPPGSPEGPVPPGSPEAQPGLGTGPEGAAQPAIGPPPASASNLAQLLGSLRRPQMTLPSERGA